MSCNNSSMAEKEIQKHFGLGTQGAIIYAVTAYIMENKDLNEKFKKRFGATLKEVQNGDVKFNKEQVDWWQTNFNLVLDSCKITEDISI